MNQPAFLSTRLPRRPALAGLAGLTLAAPAALLPSPASAQSTPAPEGDVEPATLTVSGVGIVSTTPDIAYVTAGVAARDASLSAAQEQVADVSEALFAIATDNGIAEADIVTADYSVQVIEDYDDNGNPTGRRTFAVSNVYALTLRDLDSTGSVIDQLVGAGANVIYGIAFGLSDPTSVADEARSLAIAEARARADAYAAGFGVAIAGIQSISEQSAPSPVQRVDAADSYEAAGAPAQAPVAAGSTDVSVSIQVVFLIAG